MPDYYEIIKEPMALSNLKEGHANRRYTTFSEFVRECALIWHNAHIYNRPDAGVYKSASLIKSIMEEEFQKLVERGIVSAEAVEWPYLGELPPVEDIAEQDEQEEGDESDDEDAPKKKRVGRPKGRKTGEGVGEPAGQKTRGRPPKIATPLEARMRNVMKGLRRSKDKDDNQRIHHFEKLPDKATLPDYYNDIKKPISVEQIKVSRRCTSIILKKG